MILPQTTYYYSSPLSKDIILEIISQQKTGRMSTGISGKLISDSKFEVFYRPGHRNSWNPIFIGVISEEPHKTMLSGTFQIPVFTTVFLWIWRGFACWFLYLMLTTFLFSPQNTEASPVLLLVPAGLIIYSFILELICKSLGKNCQREVLEFFVKKLSASPEYTQVIKDTPKSG